MFYWLYIVRRDLRVVYEIGQKFETNHNQPHVVFVPQSSSVV